MVVYRPLGREGILDISNSDKLSFRPIQKPSLFPQLEAMNSILFFITTITLQLDL